MLLIVFFYQVQRQKLHHHLKGFQIFFFEAKDLKKVNICDRMDLAGTSLFVIYHNIPQSHMTISQKHRFFRFLNEFHFMFHQEKFIADYEAAQRKKEEEKPEEEEEDEEDEDDSEDGKLDTYRELLESIRESREQNHGRIDDQLIIQLYHEKLLSKPCQNQGFILDGFPKLIDQAKELFDGDYRCCCIITILCDELISISFLSLTHLTHIIRIWLVYYNF